MSELLTKGKVAVSVHFDTVAIEISCGDAYEAQSLFDELVERLRLGQGVTLGMRQPDATLSPASSEAPPAKPPS